MIQGHGAAQAANEFLARGAPVPGDIRDKINAANADGVGRKTAAALLKADGNPRTNSMRVFRTEINRAHGLAYIESAKQSPDTAGFRYLLSPAHPKPDICDLYSMQNLFGLGPGVYPPAEITDYWPAHPNILSYLVVVFDDEISGADRSGKETAIAALERLTQAQRIGVLGVAKTAFFAQGRLTASMIRAPLKAIRGRVARLKPRDNAPVTIIAQPPRSPWRDFPGVLIHVDESAAKSHAYYSAAKSGDIGAAERLVTALASDAVIATIGQKLAGRDVIVSPVQALEAEGQNIIPTALGALLANRLKLGFETNIVQTNHVGHTGASGWERLANPALFDGVVEDGRDYLLVDDFIGQGGTLANLKGFVERGGGRVLLATTLTGKTYSAKLGLSADTLSRLRDRHGQELEDWWRRRFGYGFEFLTESEARYPERAEDADVIRNRIVAAAQKG